MNCIGFYLLTVLKWHIHPFIFSNLQTYQFRETSCDTSAPLLGHIKAGKTVRELYMYKICGLSKWREKYLKTFYFEQPTTVFLKVH